MTIIVNLKIRILSFYCRTRLKAACWLLFPLEANVIDFGNPISNAHIWPRVEFAKIQQPQPQIINVALASPRKSTQSRSIALQGAELWPFKEGNRLRNFSKFGKNYSSVFKH